MYYVFSLTHSPPPSLPPSISISQMMVPDLKKKQTNKKLHRIILGLKMECCQA